MGPFTNTPTNKHSQFRNNPPRLRYPDKGNNKETRKKQLVLIPLKALSMISAINDGGAYSHRASLLNIFLVSLVVFKITFRTTRVTRRQDIPQVPAPIRLIGSGELSTWFGAYIRPNDPRPVRCYGGSGGINHGFRPALLITCHSTSECGILIPLTAQP